MEPKKMRFWEQKFIRTKKFLLKKRSIFICRKPDEVDHTPLADAIMIGNVEIVKAIMPYTKVIVNSKGQRFRSMLLSSMVTMKSSKFYYNISKPSWNESDLNSGVVFQFLISYRRSQWWTIRSVSKRKM